MTTSIITLKVLDITEDTVTNTGGLTMYVAMEKAFDENLKVSWDMEGVQLVSSSFLNSSIGNLIDKYGATFFKAHFSITKYTRYQVEFIKDYITKYELLVR